MAFMAPQRVKALIGIFLVLAVYGTANAKIGETPVFRLYAREIIDQFAGEMKKEFGLRCQGGSEEGIDDVEEIEVLFEAPKKATIGEARKLEVCATKRLVQIVNAHEKIRPYLVSYPFPADRTHISIHFDSKRNARHPDGSVVGVTHIRDKIYYERRNLLTGDLEYALVEPYEESVRIVENPPKITQARK